MIRVALTKLNLATGFVNEVFLTLFNLIINYENIHLNEYIAFKKLSISKNFNIPDRRLKSSI